MTETTQTGARAGTKQLCVMVIVLVVAFFVLRLPGLHLPYYQDEWKNVSASATAEGAGHFFAHPPLMQMLFVADRAMFGVDGFRLMPLVFAAAAGVLLFLVVRGRFGRRAALWSSALYMLCFYSVLGSLQPDVDGSVLPFFFLLAVWAHDKGRSATRRWPWAVLFVVALLAGMLTKLSFAIVIGAFILDFIWEHRRNRPLRHVGLAAGSAVMFAGLFVAFLYLIQVLYSPFSISFMLTHAHQFAGTGGRNWTQIIVQGIKALYYLSPLLIAPLILLDRETLKRGRVFALFIALGLVFYFVLFDFSQGALDKYLMFLTVPIAVLAGAVVSRGLEPTAAATTATSAATRHSAQQKTFLVVAIAVIISALILAVNWLPHTVVGLYPKSEWFSHVAHLRWNILTPMNGGSGPMGFYVSFLFIALSYGVTLVLAVAARMKRSWITPALILILAIGLSYNLVLTEEYEAGRLNGSSATVLAGATEFLSRNPSVDRVLTYNDIGARELTDLGRYAGRFYAAPQFEEGHRAAFAKFTGYYMIVDVPHIYENSFYGQFFARCYALWRAVSGRITGTIYACPRS